MTGRKLALAAALGVVAACAPPAYAGYSVSLGGPTGTSVTATAHATHNGALPADDVFELEERALNAAYGPPSSDTRRWVLWPNTDIPADALIDNSGTADDSENCRYFDHHYRSGGDDGAKCSSLAAVNVTGQGANERVRIETQFATNRTFPITASLAGGNDQFTLGRYLNGSHTLGGGAGTADTLRLPAGSSWTVDLETQTATGGPAPIAISGWENLDTRIDGTTDTVVVNGSSVVNELDLDATDVTAHGQAGSDVITASYGTSRVYGEAGDDELDAGFFADNLHNQYVEGNDGDDEIDVSGEGSATAKGGVGDDEINASAAGFNDVDGGPDDDRVFGGDGLLDAVGGDGNDELSTGDGSGELDGGPGDDELTLVNFTSAPGTADGGPGSDDIQGWHGPDVLRGGTGNADEIWGWHGADTITVDATATNTVLYGDIADTSGDLGDYFPGNDDITGSEGVDTINGGGLSDRITALGGADTIRGDNSLTDATADPRGADTIDAGAGADTVFGGPGDDTITGGPGDDVIDCGDGVDTVTDPEPGDTLTDCDQDFTVTLEAFNPSGQPITGQAHIQQDIVAVLTLTNASGEELSGFEFANDAPLVVDPRSPGGLVMTSGPAPALDPNLTIPNNESVSFTYRLTPTAEGVAAAHTKVTAQGESGDPYEGHMSLKFQIADAQRIAEDLGRFIVLQAVDQFLMKHVRDYYAGMTKVGNELYEKMRKQLSPAELKKWFGSKKSLAIGPEDVARAQNDFSAPEVVAARLPEKKVDGYTAEELENEYIGTLYNEVGKGVEEWVKGWKDLGAKAKKGLKDSWSEAVLSGSYMIGTATPEERMQMEAFWGTLGSGTGDSVFSFYDTLFKEIPKWQENGTYAWQALEESEKQVKSFAPKLIAKESKVRNDMLKYAQSDPARFQREWAKHDAEIINAFMPTLLETLIGGGTTRVISGGRKIVMGGKGAAVVESAQATGVLDETGDVAKGLGTAVERTDEAIPTGMNALEAAALEESGGMIKNTPGATLVQSSDYGHVYELPNLGGVPEVTLDAKAAILGELEGEYLKATGKELRLVEILKPSSALRKEAGVAKLELTAEKTAKPAMLDGGMPPDALGEASVWRSPTHPRKLPGFDEMPKARQEAAVKEWEKANKAWAEFENPTDPTSKTARLKQCIGQRNRVPLDLEPNKQGIQRFVTAEFEVVHVKHGKAEAKLIRVKHYEVEVVDTTRNNQVVNRKTVIQNSPEALPQGPDADAVGVGKVVGTGADGRPIIEPLNRAEREFVMGRYINKNIQARRAGTIKDLAEHGATLVMDDAGAKAAGKLLPSFGVPFLPEEVGRKFLARIAPFVQDPAHPIPNEEMVQKMLNLVQSEGGFGQHAVVVTADTRYFGELAVNAW